MSENNQCQGSGLTLAVEGPVERIIHEPLGLAAFAAVTGTSIASAAAFSRIAYPEMMKFKYKREFALGSIAGSACLGMLIPPSVLLIVWGIITEQSIGKLFVAGVIPGILLSALFIAYTIGAVKLNPSLAPEIPSEELDPITKREIVSTRGSARA